MQWDREAPPQTVAQSRRYLEQFGTNQQPRGFGQCVILCTELIKSLVPDVQLKATGKLAYNTSYTCKIVQLYLNSNVQPIL